MVFTKHQISHPSEAAQGMRSDLHRMAELEEEELLGEFSTSREGLSWEEAQERLEKTGPNIIQTHKGHPILKNLKESLFNPFSVILLVVALVTYVSDVLLAEEASYLTVIIILVLVSVSGLVSFVQSQRSDSAVKALTGLISNRSHVFRDAKLVEILMEEVVPGDIVWLAAGDMLPADVRFLSTKDTFLSQAALTGESQPVEKFSVVTEGVVESLTDLSTIGFMGSNLISGSARALVVATGNASYFGSMAHSFTGDRAPTSFERGVDAVGKLLVRMMAIMVPVIFLINGFTKSDWAGALLFAVTIAVGLTPEMLPVIMTSTLAKGALSMSNHKVIVRTLGAIQTFGEMDVLCTDKTGTLTEDKIILEKYMDVHGHEDQRILRHAYLNSHFQTGLKNLIDLAIISRAEKTGLGSLLSSYTTVDEIPFDFSRRRMSVVLEDRNGKSQLITKGAVEEMLMACSFVEIEGKVVALDDQTRRTALETYEKHNNEGLRMIAVAQKNEVAGVGIFGVEDEKEMVLIGFVGFLDPPKESAGAAIKALREHGVRTIVLTGDSEGVAIKVCDKVGVPTEQVLTGRMVELMDDETLEKAVETCDLFAKLSPSQKERVVRALQKKGHTVGYMGDGINDALPLRQSDVGISVDSGVDIAKETADIILLEKDLRVLEEGVLEGRHTFGNIIKYIKMATSGNFGNMFSLLIASIFLPFLPMLPVQILTQNLLTDFSQIGMPFDRVDPEYLMKPRKWETSSIRSFMYVMGPLSSIFDILCFALLWWVIGANTSATAPLFQAGWFVFGTVSQILIIYMIRTEKVSFVRSRPSGILVLSTLLVAAVALFIGFSDVSGALEMVSLPLVFVPWLGLLLLGYALSVQLIKGVYVRRYGEWL